MLVAYFWSRTCDSCEGLGPPLAALAGPETVVAAFEATDDRALHRRYDVQAIPMILIVALLVALAAGFGLAKLTGGRSGAAHADNDGHSSQGDDQQADRQQARHRHGLYRCQTF